MGVRRLGNSLGFAFGAAFESSGRDAVEAITKWNAGRQPKRAGAAIDGAAMATEADFQNALRQERGPKLDKQPIVHREASAHAATCPLTLTIQW